MNPITDFDFGDHNFLSNFWEEPVTYDGLTYGNSEAAFQAQKVYSHELRKKFTEMDPGTAKSFGNRVHLRPDWESVKIQIMREILALKFFPGSTLARLLLDTGDAHLIEGNTWNDHFWGVCDGWGDNHLGVLLMERRGVLRLMTVI